MQLSLNENAINYNNQKKTFDNLIDINNRYTKTTIEFKDNNNTQHSN